MKHIICIAALLLTPLTLHALAAVAQAAVSQAVGRPNVVVFLSDDQGWGDLNSSGNSDLSTPNIDSLAKTVASFDRFYVCPVCSPTRAEFLTGRHHARAGVYSTSAGGERMNLDETTIAELFKAAGYTTAAFGKWHNGMQYPYHPNGRGFDEFYGFCSGHWGNYFNPMLEHNGRIVKGTGFCIDDFTSRAIGFMKKAVADDKPFFAYLPYNTPHSPMQVPDNYWKRFADRPLKFKNEQKAERASDDTHKRCALAMCENLDWNVGRVLEQLDALHVADNTIVVWFHDNGPNGVRWNGGMKGRKGSTDEGGVRSPLYIRWTTGIAPGTKVPQIASARDLLPTLCELAGIPYKTAKPLDGMSLQPLLHGPDSKGPDSKGPDSKGPDSKGPDSKGPDSKGAIRTWPDRVLINQWRDKISARSDRFRLDNTGKMYDMLADPGQRTAVNKDHPDVLGKLTEKVAAHRAQFMPGYFKDERPFVIAHPGSRFTQLPARDAKAHGQIKRSNRFPNCSYFTNWTRIDDTITFQAEVATAGTFKVDLFYAAKEAGAKCELRFNDSVLPFEITEAHDVPAQGAEHDRHARMESYVKDFRSVCIGQIQLEPGRGELTLRAVEIPGVEAMEFRLLLLERVE